MKKCKICNKEKLYTDFYKHPGTKDKLLNRCKDCSINQSKKRYEATKSDIDLLLKERERQRNKYYKYKYKSKKNYNIDLNYYLKYPEKRKAKMACQYIKTEKGYQKHHWSYNENHFTDVIIIDTATHYKLHRYLVYDKEYKQYRKIENNELIDAKEKHIDYINYIKNLPF